MGKIFGWLMIELPDKNEVDFSKAIQDESSYELDNLRYTIEGYNKHDPYGNGSDFVQDNTHTLGMVDSALRSIGFKEEIGFHLNGTKRYLYTYEGKNIGIVKALYSIYMSMDKLPIKFYGIGYEENPMFEYTTFAYCNKIGRNLKMDMISIEHTAGQNIEPLREAFERMPIKERLVLAMSNAGMQGLFRSLEDMLKNNPKEGHV